MKTIFAGALALSLLAGTAASAAPHGYDQRDQRDHRQEARHDQRDNRQHWRQGQRLPSNYRTRSHYVDYRQHHLRQPPRG